MTNQEASWMEWTNKRSYLYGFDQSESVLILDEPIKWANQRAFRINLHRNLHQQSHLEQLHPVHVIESENYEKSKFDSLELSVNLLGLLQESYRDNLANLNPMILIISLWCLSLDSTRLSRINIGLYSGYLGNANLEWIIYLEFLDFCILVFQQHQKIFVILSLLCLLDVLQFDLLFKLWNSFQILLWCLWNERREKMIRIKARKLINHGLRMLPEESSVSPFLRRAYGINGFEF